MRPPRGLTASEAEAWARLASTVKPINPPRKGEGDRPKGGGGESPHKQTSPAPPGASDIASAPPGGERGERAPPRRRAPPPSPPPSGAGLQTTVTLDGTWERKFARGTLAPDFTLDLHGHSLDAAHRRLDDGLLQAKALGARVVLLITGKSRPVDAADRATRRGAIRAKVLDWLAAGPHGADIAAIRTAHRRHGGEGALYLVLRRRKSGQGQ